MKKILIAGNPEKVPNYTNAMTALGAISKVSLDPADADDFAFDYPEADDEE